MTAYTFKVSRLLPPSTVMDERGHELPEEWRGMTLPEMLAAAVKANIPLVVSQNVFEAMRAQFPSLPVEVNT